MTIDTGVLPDPSAQVFRVPGQISLVAVLHVRRLGDAVGAGNLAMYDANLPVRLAHGYAVIHELRNVHISLVIEREIVRIQHLGRVRL